MLLALGGALLAGALTTLAPCALTLLPVVVGGSVTGASDRAAVRRSGEVATARALITLAGSRTPEAALGVGTTAPVRLRLLADGPPSPVLPVAAYSFAAVAATLPLLLLGKASRSTRS